MGYGRLVSDQESGSTSRRQILADDHSSEEATTKSPRSCKLKPVVVISGILLVASAIAAGVFVAFRTRASGEPLVHRKPTAAISHTCSKTRFPSLCVDSLLNFPGALTASDKDLVHITVNMTLQRFDKAFYDVSDLSNVVMDPSVRSAYDDCLELLGDSVDLLSRSLSLTTVPPTDSGSSSLFSSTQNVLTWLSAALTNQDTCVEGFNEVNGGNMKNLMSAKLKDLSELVSNCLAIYSASNGNDDFSGIPIGNRRRLMDSQDVVGHDLSGEQHENFPHWLSKRERMLLDMPVTKIQADIIVSSDGNGTVKTIAEAIKKVPEHSDRRFIIYVRAGKYVEENLKVGRKKTNVMFMGDGKGKTIIAGGKSVADHLTTFHTASFAATGAGFIARDITFENWAGPQKHQAVALRVGADHGVVYRCSIIGYQDTLYVHSQRQFFRECDVYGTVDFIFGNAAVVFQNCSLYARKPMAMQKNTITAQNRKDPNQNTGISIHACKIVATPDLHASKGSFPTYLGRPWKLYSRTVYMLSNIGDHVHPRGWLEWNATFALDTLYYGEYMNYGPGAALGQRVKWPGYHVIKTTAEASKFTVGQFIFGSSWLPSTGVAFMAGLST